MRLAVSLGAAKVGTLARVDEARVAFAFDRAYLATRGRPVLGQFYTDKLRRPPPPSPQLPAFFANLLPEGKLRALVASAIGAREHHELRLLAHLGADLPGAVRVVPEDGEASALEPEPPAPPHRELAGRLRFSLAGVQLKFSMLRQGKGLVLPARGQDGDWLIKLPDLELEDVPENEYAVMGWARDSGIEVPEFEAFTHAQVEGIDRRFFPEGTVAFGVRRFDRPAPGVRVHLEDFAQVNGCTRSTSTTTCPSRGRWRRG